MLNHNASTQTHTNSVKDTSLQISISHTSTNIWFPR
jgi:hypothetical protein